MQRVRVVADNVEAAALRGPLRAERCDDHVPAGLHGTLDLTDIGGALRCAGQEMEHGAIMPNVIALRGQNHVGDVGGEP